jgi:hypothetical protein
MSEETFWRSLMRDGIHKDDHEMLAGVERCLNGRVTFRIVVKGGKERIVYDFHPDPVRYRLVRNGDWIDVQRPTADLRHVDCTEDLITAKQI